MSSWLWLLSFLYLVGVCGWVTVRLREEDGPPDDDEPSLPRRALSFAAMLAIATVFFAGVVWAIETLT